MVNYSPSSSQDKLASPSDYFSNLLQLERQKEQEEEVWRGALMNEVERGEVTVTREGRRGTRWCKLSVHTREEENMYSCLLQEGWKPKEVEAKEEELAGREEGTVRRQRKGSGCRLTLHCAEQEEELTPGTLLSLSMNKQEKVG